jgi:hypothetical protein
VRRPHLPPFAAALALAAGLALAGPAAAAQDELSGGTVTLETASSKALKLGPASLSLSITGGAVDPVGGDGTVKAAGTLRVKSGKRKSKVAIKGFVFGAGGGPGTIDAKVGKKRVAEFGEMSGGTVVREGLGARISGVGASLGADGAKALNRALKAGKGKGKGKGRAASSRKIKAGEALGTVSAITVPKTVEVLPGGSMTLHTDPDLLSKFLAHCINALPGTGGVYPVAPATQDPVSAAFTFPVTGGAMAPSLADGTVVTGGGQGITKNVGGTIPYSCDQEPAVGTTVTQSLLTANFAGNSLAASVELPGGSQTATIANIDFSTGTKTFDPATNQITVTGATVTLDRLAAIILNDVFPNRSGDPNNDLGNTDVLGTLDLTATLR